MNDPLIESLLTSESVDVALDRVRTSRTDPAEASASLRALAEEVRNTRPATAHLAIFLADRVAGLADPHEWIPKEHLSPAANEALKAASAQRTWPGTLAVLRAHSAELTEEDMYTAAAWHSELAQCGVPPRSNGIAVVICLGVLLGGSALAYAHAIWARACEDRSLARADFHFRRAAQLIADCPDREDAVRIAVMRRAFLERHGLPHEDEPADEEFDDSPMSLPLREARAYTLREAGRLQEALALLGATISLAVRIGDDAREMRLRILRGLVYEDLDEHELGAAEYELAGRLADALGDNARSFEARNNAAASLLKQGLMHRGVEAFMRILRQIDSSGSLGQRVAARNNLGLAFAREGNFRRALNTYLDAVQLARDHDMDPSPTTLTGLALVYQDLGDLDKARGLDELKLVNWFESRDIHALATYLTSRTTDLTPDAVRKAAESAFEHLLTENDHRFAFLLATRLSDLDRTQGKPESALARLDRVLDHFMPIRALTSLAITAELDAAVIEFDDLQRRQAGLQRLRSAIARVEQRLASTMKTRDADQVLRSARPLYQALIERLIADGAVGELTEAFDLHEACRPATWTTARSQAAHAEQNVARTARLADVISALSHICDDTVAVVSLVETAATIGVFVVRSDNPSIEYLPLPVSAEEARAAAAEFSTAANGDATAFPPRRALDPLRPSATPLSRFTSVMDRIGIFIPNLAGVTIAFVVLSPSLTAIPVAAIRSPTGQYLVQAIGVVHQPSIGALVRVMTTDRPSVRSPSIFVAGVAAIEDQHPEFFESDMTMFAGSRWQFDSAVATDVTPARVIDGMRRADIVHVTCHGYVDIRDPLRSGLLLSDGERRPTRRLETISPMERGRFLLPVEALRTERIDTELVTMRACSTARRSRAESNEEVATLLEALHLAGCRRIVTSLWNVDQRSSQALLESFYASYLTGAAPAWKALANAQRAMIEAGGPWSHVYHWAAFVVSGDWR
jgi:tetratricopeptide (TPR) repeat protein